MPFRAKILAVAVVLSCVAVFAATPPQQDPALTNVASVLQLTPEQATAQLPIHLTAAVTYADPLSGILFVEDATGGIFVGTRQALPRLNQGALLDIQGRSDAGIHLPAISQASVQVLGQSRRLAPARPKSESILSGQYDCRFIELRGVVRQVGQTRGQATLTIEAADGSAIEARFLGLTRTNLWDARVRVRGVCGLHGMRDKRVISVLLYCSGNAAITIEKPGLPDPFAAPVQHFRDLDSSKKPARTRIDGRVMAISSSGTIAVQDDARQTVTIDIQNQTLLRTNDLVQVSAVPSWSDGQLTFQYVQLRAMAPAASMDRFIGPRPLVPLVTRLADVRRLGENADAGFPVRVRGVVTYYDRAWMLFIQDDSAGIYVHPGDATFNIAPGQLVEVDGITEAGLYAPVIVRPHFSIVEDRVAQPSPKSVLADVLLRGQHDSLRVEVTGLIESVKEGSSNTAQINLITSAGLISTFLLVTNSALPTNLVNAEVRVRGVCGSTFNNRRQFTGARLFVASASDIGIERPAPSDPFAVEAQPVSNLLKFGSAPMHRVKVSGVVTFADPRKSLLCVQDGTGGVFVRVQNWPPVQPGSVVDVLGFPTISEYSPRLIEATVRPMSGRRSLAPKPIMPAAALAGSNDSEFVSMEVRLLDRFTRRTNDVLVLQAGGASFEAEKPHVDDRWLASLEPQSRLRVAGICVVLVNQASTPRHFKLLLRGPEDVAVLSTPSMWQDHRFRVIAASAFVLTVMPVVWVGLLRRKVRQQTAIIAAQLAREQRYNDELEEKVRDRTRALSEAHDKLRVAHDQLESRVLERTVELSRANVALQEEIGERRRSEQALRVSEERFSKAFRSGPIPMGISTERDGTFLDVNEALAQTLGYTRDELLSARAAEASVWANGEDRARALAMLDGEKPVRDWQVELRTKGGEVRHVLASIEKIFVKEAACLVIIFNDITQRVQLEAQLRQSQKMEAVGQLAAGIAHDFNNMLTVIHGHVGLLMGTIRDEDQLGSLGEVSRAADRAAGLTRQLLTFSRRQPLMSRALDLNQVIGNTSEMLRRILGEPIRLSFRHAPLLPVIHADQGMIEQIILNLAVNARDAMPNGGRLEFATSVRTISHEYARRNPDASSGDFVCMSVSDTGCGMDAMTLSRAFEPFFTTKEVGKGTGLGLATVYGIVRQHGGWIEVSSAVGRGTDFQIYFPSAGSGAAAQRTQPADAPVRGGDETILLVEDEGGVRDLASNVLRRYGYEVVCATNGTEALQAWKSCRDRIDLLLTDMVMPEGPSGRELAGRLRADFPKLKVVYTSGYSVEFDDRDMSLHEGMNFIPKPYAARNLAAVVRNCLDA